MQLSAIVKQAQRRADNSLTVVHREGEASLTGGCDVPPGGADRRWSGHRHCLPPGLVFLPRQMQGRLQPYKVSEGKLHYSCTLSF